MVLSCSPPDLIVFTWRSPEWRSDTEVDVRFVPEGAGTSVRLEHRGWEGSARTGKSNGRTAGPGSSTHSRAAPPSANDTSAILPAQACYRRPVHVCCPKTASTGGMLRSDPRQPSRGGKRRVRRDQDERCSSEPPKPATCPAHAGSRPALVRDTFKDSGGRMLSATGWFHHRGMREHEPCGH
jgi:hypothetical protein